MNPTKFVTEKASEQVSHLSISIITLCLRSIFSQCLTIVTSEGCTVLASFFGVSVEALVVGLVLHDGGSSQRIHRMVRVGSLRWLILTSTLHILAAENRIGLDSLRTTNPLTVHVRLALRSDIKQLK